MAFTRIDIGNQALALVGSEPIAAFDDGSAEGQQLAQHYDVVVGLALTAPGGAPFRWSFATAQEALTRLATDPQARYACAYQVPARTLILHSVMQNDMPLRFTRQEDRILCDEENTTTPIIADLTFSPDESMWPPYFSAGVVGELGARLAVGLNENRALANTILSGLNWRGARTADSQARSSPRLRATRLISARFSR